MYKEATSICLQFLLQGVGHLSHFRFGFWVFHHVLHCGHVVVEGGVLRHTLHLLGELGILHHSNGLGHDGGIVHGLHCLGHGVHGSLLDLIRSTLNHMFHLSLHPGSSLRIIHHLLRLLRSILKIFTLLKLLHLFLEFWTFHHPLSLCHHFGIVQVLHELGHEDGVLGGVLKTGESCLHVTDGVDLGVLTTDVFGVLPGDGRCEEEGGGKQGLD
mmetsp:Transcript_7659/g.11219  ORF Transcript_7659/g.11219 Transcript_7659/m.11219 type:complete len:214 (+) Transcript_7659:193-834(+)